jgi:hypothetical protein
LDETAIISKGQADWVIWAKMLNKSSTEVKNPHKNKKTGTGSQQTAELCPGKIIESLFPNPGC